MLQSRDISACSFITLFQSQLFAKGRRELLDTGVTRDGVKRDFAMKRSFAFSGTVGGLVNVLGTRNAVRRHAAFDNSTISDFRQKSSTNWNSCLNSKHFDVVHFRDLILHVVCV